jgi:2-aminoethylphosphonate-pyruvate transaminase
MKLLNPGPVTLTDRVRKALAQPDLCHREPDFEALQNEICDRLLSVYPEAVQDFTTVLLTGSGTAAVEAMVGSLVPRDGHALVVVNGVYGERMAAMLRAQGKAVHLVQSEWTEPMDLAAVVRILSSEPRISHVLAVHHETTTGRLNDLAKLGGICSSYDVPLLLDCVSSFGGEEIDFENWNIQACASTANKCLHGAPGMSFVLVRRSALQSGQSGATSVYLDLFRHYAEQRKSSSAFTQSVHICYALLEALKELEDSGGWRSRNARFAALSRQVFNGLRAQGVEPLLKISAPSSAVMTAYRIPQGYAYSSLHDFLKAAGFVIYAGQGQFSQEIFRIAVMGALDYRDMDDLLDAFQSFWKTRTLVMETSQCR